VDEADQNRARLAKIKQHQAAGVSKSAKHLGRELICSGGDTC
jgi:hypothetical protein